MDGGKFCVPEHFLIKVQGFFGVSLKEEIGRDMHGRTPGRSETEPVFLSKNSLNDTQNARELQITIAYSKRETDLTFVGDGAVVDPQFNTTDVCVIVQTSAVTDKYYKHYEREARGG